MTAYESAQRAYDAMNPQIDSDEDGSENDCK